ncbi:MAG: peptidylprolyl isomerase [Anaerocolumna sp.]
MKKTKRIVSLLLMFLLAVGMTFATGCSKNEDPAKSVVVTVNDKDVYLDEVMYYVMAVESTGAEYDAAYLQYTGTSYWDTKGDDGVTMSDQAKQYVMDTAEMYTILYDKAVKAGYTLTDDEKTQAGTSADQILTSISEDQLAITGFTKESLTNVQEKLILAGRYYQDLIDGFDIDDAGIKATIKRDDYKQYKTEYLFVPTTKYDESYNSVDLSEDEKATAKASITAALDKVKAGEEFSKITDADNTITTNTLNFILDDNTAEKEYQDAAVKLENDAYTPDIVETDTGYYIIKMDDNNSTEAYDTAVDTAISDAEQTAFKTEYDTMKKDYTLKINDKVWDPIVIGKTTIAATDATGNAVTDNSTADTTTGDATTEDTATGE